MKKRIWYAVESDREDTDWGTGSYDLTEAKNMLRNYPDGLIAAICNGYIHEDGTEEDADPVCIEEIPYTDVF